jgi:tRNA U34 5-methylaminomethyl-2-thiouridine-forming methyltransferase MnmC
MNKNSNLDHPLFEIVTTTAGVVSIRNKLVNEIMHNPVGPWAEANALYIDQSQLRKRLHENIDQEFIIFDVGLGAAANALAALACARSLSSLARPLKIISFERDLGLLQFALDHAVQFSHFSGFESILQQILEKHQWSNEKISWELRAGDFLELIEQEHEHPHLIFYDPYSPKMNQEMWTTSIFKSLRKLSRGPETGATSLYTYSQSTRIRAALIEAGFYVGRGASTGLKSHTTEASTDFKILKMPLGPEWLMTWKRSESPYPYGCKDKAAVAAALEKYF